MINRQIVPFPTLKTLVETEAADQVAKQFSFTAYDITISLKADNPDLEIRHREVRPLVHDYMANVAGYEGKDEAYGGDWAITYSPIIAGLSTAQTHSVSTAPKQPTLVQKAKNFLTIHWGK